MFLFVIKIIFTPLILVNYLIPKNKKLWIFGASNGRKYNDNPRALFEYVNEYKKDIRAIWITRNRAEEQKVRNKGYEVYRAGTLAGIYYSIRAGVILTSHSFKDVSLAAFLFPRKTKLVNLWHGTFLKRIFGCDDLVFTGWTTFLTLLLRGYLGRTQDMVVAACALSKETFLKHFFIKYYSIPDEFVKITGQPRNDRLFSAKNSSGVKKIIYVPTWRDYDVNFDLFGQFGFDVAKLDAALQDADAELFIKLHMGQAGGRNIKDEVSRSKRIKFLEVDDIYDVLGEMDALINDYSNVFFDFLLLNRPMIFAPFDLGAYREKRGFFYDYDAVTPGPKARNWDEVAELIKRIFVKDEYAEKRKEVNDMFNYWQDDRSCARVYDEIIRLIEI